MDLAAYLVYKKEEGIWKSESAFGSARSAIADMFKFQNGSTTSIGDDPHVNAIMNVIRKTAPAPREKKPLTQAHFTELVKHVKRDNFASVRNYYTIMLLFAMGRRGIEATKFLTANVTAKEKEKVLEVKFIPAKQIIEAYTTQGVNYREDNEMLNVRAWHELYMGLRAKQCQLIKMESDFYFMREDGGRLTPDSIYCALKSMFANAGMDSTGISMHSARVGAATAMAEAGTSREIINEVMTFHGNQAATYIKTAKETKAAATNHLQKKRGRDEGKEKEETESKKRKVEKAKARGAEAKQVEKGSITKWFTQSHTHDNHSEKERTKKDA